MNLISPVVTEYLEAWNKRGETLRPERAEKKGQDRKGKKDPYRFRASEIGYCMARLSWDWIREHQERRTAHELSILYSGEVWGQRITKMLGSRVIEKEVYRCAAFPHKGVIITIDGHADLIVKCLDGKCRIVEVKEMGHYGFQEVTNDDEPYEHQTDQLRAYLALFQGYKYSRSYSKDGPRIDDTGILLIKPRSGGVPVEFTVESSEQEWEKILDRLKEVGDARAAGKTAGREYLRGEPPCTWCPHDSVCWRMEDTGNGKAPPKQVTATKQNGLLSLIALQAEKVAAEGAAGIAKQKLHSRVMDVLDRYQVNVLDADDDDNNTRFRVSNREQSRTTRSLSDATWERLEKQGKVNRSTTNFPVIKVQKVKR